MPSPIITATASPTRMVGMIGSLRIIRPASLARAGEPEMPPPPATAHLPSREREGRNSSMRRRAPAAPDIDGDEQEQPHDVDEVPVPGGRLEPEMLLGGEVALVGADQADGQEDGADDDMGAVEAGRHEEGGAVDVALKVERRVDIFITLDEAEQQAEEDGAPQALLQPLAVAMDQRMVRPGDGRARAEQDEGVQEREAERVEHLDAL